MRVLALIPAILTMAFASTQGREPLRLKRGDSVIVTSEYGGEFRIMTDGAIYGRGFGRLVLEGLTWSEAETALQKSLHKFVKEDEVHLTFKDLHRDVVYLVGTSGGRGATDLQPDMRLRQLLASAPIDENADLVQVQLFRDGKKICEDNVAELLAGTKNATDPSLQADDVVTLTPATFFRVWVTGLVEKPGLLRLPAGTDPYKAVAQSGGIKSGDLASDRTLQDEATIVVRRGPNTFELPYRPDAKTTPMALEAGDTVTVLMPQAIRLTVSGEVNHPGEVIMRGEHSLIGAVAMASGVNSNGTLAHVLVLRRGELFNIDASGLAGDKKLTQFSVEANDLVYIQRNERTFLVLGDVAKPGRITMLDGKTYRLSDALAEVSGLNNRGTLRRAALARPDATGKVVVEQFNLDAFLKDGDKAHNPEIKPGDCIFFGEPKGITLGSISQALSGAILFETITRNRP